MANSSGLFGDRIEGGVGGVTMLPFPTISDVINTQNLTNITESTNVTRARKTFSFVEQILFGTWLSISMILAIFGNLMVIAVVVRHRGMRTRTNMFLVSLAVADFLIGILLAPFSLATLIAQDWVLGPVLCTINSFLNAACFITSIHTLMHISIHKYLSITRPLTRITKCKILVMISAAWGWGLTCAALTTVILSHAEFKEGTMQCGPAYPVITTKSLLFHIIIQTSNIFLPLFIMIFAYSRMFGEIREHMQRMDENTAMDRAQIYNQQRRVTITLFIVLACFVLCWIPYCVYANYVTFEPDKTKFPPYLNAIAYCFGYMNSACNPIIYAWRSPSFREGYKEILCQEPSYVVSDEQYEMLDHQSIRLWRHQDTVCESSPNPLRRISTFISSVRGSRSDEVGSHTVRGHPIARQISTDSSYKLLHKLTGKTKAKSGSSVIRRDGSVILVKNGKIISMKLDTKLRKSDNDDVFVSSPSTAGSNGSKIMCSSPSGGLEVLHERDSDGYSTDDRPMFPNGRSNNKSRQLLYPNGNSNTCNSLSDDSDCDSIQNKEHSPRSKSHLGDLLQDADIEINILEDKMSEKFKDDSKSLNNNTETKSPAEKKKFCLLPWTKGHMNRKRDTSTYLNTTLKEKDKRVYAKSSDAIYSVPLLKTSPAEVTMAPVVIRHSSSFSNGSAFPSPPSNLPLSELSSNPNISSGPS